MTTTVNRVYVDPTGEVRMSPNGWPEKPTEGQNWPYLKGVKYETLLQKAKEESIPFEDQDKIKALICFILAKETHGDDMAEKSDFIKSFRNEGFKALWYMNIKTGFYTIEPIQVELIHSIRCASVVSDGLVKRGASIGVCNCKPVARIVTEEEKQADYETPLHSLVNGLMQPAPVVDKPVQTISVPVSLIPKGAKLVEAYETERSITVMFCPGEEVPENHNCDEMGCGSFSHVKHILPRQQPTEWIPVSAQTIPALDGDLSKRYYKDGARSVSKLFLLHAKHYEDLMTGYLYEVDDPTLQGSDRFFWELIGIGDASFDEVISYMPVPALPEPPKP